MISHRFGIAARHFYLRLEHYREIMQNLNLPPIAPDKSSPYRLRHLDTKAKFLIVENDPNDAFLIRRALEKGNCAPACVCRNVSEAKAYLKGAGMYGDRSKYPMPDVILTDLRMETESGVDLVEWIRHQEQPLRDITVLILTGSASPTQFDAAQKVGAQGVHRKPTRLEDLQELLAGIAAEFCRK